MQKFFEVINYSPSIRLLWFTLQNIDTYAWEKLLSPAHFIYKNIGLCWSIKSKQINKFLLKLKCELANYIIDISLFLKKYTFTIYTFQKKYWYWLQKFIKNSLIFVWVVNLPMKQFRVRDNATKDPNYLTVAAF